MHPAFHPLDLQFGQVGRAQLNQTDIRAQMEAQRLKSEQFHEYCGKQVLTRVLLHMVVAARPVDLAVHGFGQRGRRRFRQHVSDPVTLIDHLRHFQAVDCSQVVRLTAGAGVEGCAIQVNAGWLSRAIYQPSAELIQVGVAVIEPFRHRDHGTRRAYGIIGEPFLRVPASEKKVSLPHACAS